MLGIEAGFLYPKPLDLIKRIIQITYKENDIYMDFFAGSGTTGHAILDFNKEHNTNLKFILITNNENNICVDITLPRIKKVFEGYTYKNNKNQEVKVSGIKGIDNFKYYSV